MKRNKRMCKASRASTKKIQEKSLTIRQKKNFFAPLANILLDTTHSRGAKHFRNHLQSTLLTIQTMILLLDGNSEHVAHA